MTPHGARSDATPVPRRGGYLLLLAMCLAWTAGIYLPALAGRPSPLYPLLRFVYAPFCHQEAARCFHVGTTALAVCGRCTAIYTTFTVVVLLYPLLRRIAVPAPGNMTLALLLLPMALDVLLDTAGILPNTMISRVATGALAGAALGLFTVPAWMEAWQARRRDINHDIPDHATDTVR